MATPSSDSVSNGLYVPTGLANGDVKPVISSTPLADFLMQLEDYTPTVSSHVMNTSDHLLMWSCLYFIRSFYVSIYLFVCFFLRSQTRSQDIISIEQDLKHQIRGCKISLFMLLQALAIQLILLIKHNKKFICTAKMKLVSGGMQWNRPCPIHFKNLKCIQA